MAISITDYLVDQNGIEWPKVLSSWSWLLPPKFTVWLVNRFADLFLVFPDGTVHMLDAGAGSLKMLADSWQHESKNCLFSQLVEKFRYVCRFRSGPFDHSMNRPPGIEVAVETAGRVGIRLKLG